MNNINTQIKKNRIVSTSSLEGLLIEAIIYKSGNALTIFTAIDEGTGHRISEIADSGTSRIEAVTRLLKRREAHRQGGLTFSGPSTAHFIMKRSTAVSNAAYTRHVSLFKTLS